MVTLRICQIIMWKYGISKWQFYLSFQALLKHISTLNVDPGRDLCSKLFTWICNPISLYSKLSYLSLQPCLIQQKIALPVSETHIDDLGTIKRIKFVMMVKEGLRIPLMTRQTDTWNSLCLWKTESDWRKWEVRKYLSQCLA